MLLITAFLIFLTKDGIQTEGKQQTTTTKER